MASLRAPALPQPETHQCLGNIHMCSAIHMWLRGAHNHARRVRRDADARTLRKESAPARRVRARYGAGGHQGRGGTGTNARTGFPTTGRRLPNCGLNPRCKWSDMRRNAGRIRILKPWPITRHHPNARNDTSGKSKPSCRRPNDQLPPVEAWQQPVFGRSNTSHTSTAPGQDQPGGSGAH